MAFSDLFYRKRNDDMETYAIKMGLDYQAKDEFGLLSYLKDFRLFREGSSKEIRHIMRPFQSA